MTQTDSNRAGSNKTGTNRIWPLTRLAVTRAVVQSAIVIERLWPLVVPLLIVISLFVSISWLGLFRIMPDWLRLGLVTGLALTGLASLYWLRFFRRPNPDEIDRRIEHANRLEHAPLRVQKDQPAAGDAFAQALWREHQKRMAAKLHLLKADLPNPRMPERDPWGLRAAASLLVVVAFAFSYGPLGGRLGDALKPYGAIHAAPARIDAWVTPPAYTGKAPIFLTAQAGESAEPGIISAPEGSIVTVRIAGGSSETLDWLEAGADTPTQIALSPDENAAQERPRRAGAPSERALQFSTRLDADGVLALSSGGRNLRRWSFAVIPDMAPAIHFTHEPGRAVNGTLELSYAIEDDYGAAAAEARFTLAEAAAPDARPLYDAPEIKLVLPRANAPDGNARTTKDLTDHPWAGSQVMLTLHAVDAAGQEAMSEEKILILPERPFTRPLARALAEQRRLLALDANNKPYVLALIDAMTLRPEETIDNPSHYLGLISARTRLKLARSDEALRDSADYLWEIALAIEGGAFSDAQKRLQQAQDALEQALQDDASDEKIAQLMEELRQAMQDFLREFAEQAARNSDKAMQMPSDMQEMRQGDLERMLDQLENLARSGAQEQAMEMLRQLRDMMNNLQAGNQQQQQGQGEQSEMRQQMDQLGQMMRRQQELMNETFRLDNMERSQGRQDGENQQDEQMSPQQMEETMRQLQEGQGELRRDLEELTQSLEGMGMQPGEGFGEAGEAMERAEGALGENEGGRATGEQGQALEALRRGAQDMMQQMQQAMGEGNGEGSGGSRSQQSSGRDPLGRQLYGTGTDFGNSVKLPDEIDVERARRILDDIRRRLGNALSPQIERDYLERLLDMR